MAKITEEQQKEQGDIIRLKMKNLCLLNVSLHYFFIILKLVHE